MAIFRGIAAHSDFNMYICIRTCHDCHFFFSHLGLGDGLVLIVPVPGHCLHLHSQVSILRDLC